MRSLVAATLVGAFVSLFAALARVGTDPARAQGLTCKGFASGKCCDPSLTRRLAKEAIYAACGQSDATFLGEEAAAGTCRYVFRVAGEKPGAGVVQVSTRGEHMRVTASPSVCNRTQTERLAASVR